VRPALEAQRQDTRDHPVRKVDEPENGYQSDFDLLAIMSHEKLTNIAEYWYVAEDRDVRDPSIGRAVNTIVHRRSIT